MTLFLKSENRILRLIYENPGIRLSELIRRARVSAETAKKRLDYLLSIGIITEETIKGGKRTLLRTFYPELKAEEKSAFILIESEKKQEFFNKNKKLIGPFKQLITNLERNVKTVLVFGSFADFSQTKDSDLDILFLNSGRISTNKLKKEIERSFITFNHEISPRIDTLRNFNKNSKTDIYSTIIKNHIIIKGTEEYFKLIS